MRRLKLLSLSTAIAGIALLPSQQAFAQQAEDSKQTTDDFHSDDEIIVTAPYFERLDFLAGTSALAGEELAERQSGQIGDVLTHLPGVSATSFAPGASRPVLRGYQGNRIAVLTDGIGNIDVSNTSADHAVTIDAITTDRIEVLRGPATLLFGGQAVGGAVNVIDKRIPRKALDKPVHIDALGSFSTAADEWALAGSADVKLADRVVFHVDGSYRDSNDLRSGGSVLTPGLREEALEFAAEERDEGNIEEAEEAEELAALRGEIPNSSVRTWTAGTGIAFIDEGGSLGVSFNIYDTRYGVPARPGAEHAEEEGEEGEEEEGPVSIDLKQYRYDLRGSVNLGGDFFEKLTLRAGFADYEHIEFEGDEVGTRFNSEGIEARVEFIQAAKNGWRGASGVQFQLRDFEAIGAEAFVPPNETQQFGLFTLQEFNLGSIEAEVALRFDNAQLKAQSLGVSRDFNNFSGALGLSYAAGDLRIGANISRTGRAPAAEELFSNGPHIATQAFEIGDVNLNSERAWNGEIFARYDANSTSFSATVFVNDFSNFIFETETGAEEDGLPVFQFFQNDARVWGFELQGSARVFEVGSTQVIIDGVADYVRATVDDTGPVPRIPPLRLLGGIEFQNADFDLRAEVEWSDDQNRVAEFETATDGFTLVNASAVWRPWGRNQNIALILAANNIFDVTARRAASFTKDFVPLAGRDFRISARFSF